MRIILLGNYPPDGQESMERFAQMLATGFQAVGAATEIWRPVPVFGAGKGTTTTGFRKWLGYLDKWVVFPIILRWRTRRGALANTGVRFHICDHSNAPYLQHLDRHRTGITCHDVLAIRGSLGHTDAYVATSRFGRQLQRWIFYYLRRAEYLASVSHLTLKQLQELASHQQIRQPAGWQVIHNAFNALFRPQSVAEAQASLSQAGLTMTKPFLLHVGSGQPRKNRGMLLAMVYALGHEWKGTICFAGEAPDEDLLRQADTLGLRTRMISVVKPNHDTLVALYNTCEAFVFPSYSEGFGWPVIEAQACGAPVIASNVEPMPEVSGGAALHASPTDPSAFAAALLTLQSLAIRNELVERGFTNCRRFEPARMIQAYLDLYGLAPA